MMLLGRGVLTEFLSTPSARRATYAGEKWVALEHISIHALCEEGDDRPRRPCELE